MPLPLGIGEGVGELEECTRGTVSTNPMEPDTLKRDDAATSREGELQKPRVSGEEDSEKDDGSESVDSKGDPSTSMPVFCGEQAW